MGFYADTLEILKNCGWNQGSIRGEDGSVCISAAMSKAVNWHLGHHSIPFQRDRMGELYAIAEDLFPRFCSYPANARVIRLNDDPQTTFEDITLLLKHASYIYDDEDT